MQSGGQILGPGEGAIVYGDSIAWEDQGEQGQGQGAQVRRQGILGWGRGRESQERKKSWGGPGEGCGRLRKGPRRERR